MKRTGKIGLPSGADHQEKNGVENGTALVEFTLVFPIFIWLMLNAVNFGMYIYAWVTVSNAARAALEYEIYSGCAVASCPSTPTYSVINSPLFTTDVSSLPGSTPTLLICRIFNGAVTSIGGTGTCSPPADEPESSIFALYSADVTYTFAPFANVAGFMYVLPTTIHRQVVMRSMQ